MSKTCIIIVGATASGKTALAINVAKYFNTEIISADSRQCFKELNIGVAKPTFTQLKEIPHHFINSHKITDNITAASFEHFALATVQKIFISNDVAVMCGGTGLYIKAFTDGLDEITEANAKIKNNILLSYEQYGLIWLQEKVKELDPLFWVQGEIQNPHRLLRALEVVMATGKSIIAQQKKEKKIRPFNIIKIGIDIPREILYERINNRVDSMQAEGLENEARNLLPFKTSNALQTVGYKELFDYFEGKSTLQKAFEMINASR